MPITYYKPGRIESLDSIRGLAALAVLLSHTLGTLEWPSSLSWRFLPFINIMFDGRSAVAMFFVLSGFVLARPYFAPAGQTSRRLLVPAFYVRRITRIWIPWFLVFCLSIFAKAYLVGNYTTNPPTTKWLEYLWHSPMTVSTFLRQCAFAIEDTKYQLLPQDWSLRIELKGSALIPVFLFLIRRHILLLLGFSLLLLVFLSSGEYYVSFALGVLMAQYYVRGESQIRSLRFSAKLGILIVGLLLYQTRFGATCLEMPRYFDKATWCACSAGCVLILAASLGSRRIQAVLNHGAITFLGRISYSVYLLQFIVLLCFLPPFVHGLNMSGIQSAILLVPLTIAFSVLVTVACSAITYRIVEVPSIEFGHRLTKLMHRGFSKEAPASG